MLNALTIDVEEWFCVSNFEHAIRREEWPNLESRVEAEVAQLLGLLTKHSVKATFYVLGWVAEKHPALVRRIADAGHELACHGYEHILVPELSPERFREDTERSLKAIEAAAGVRCTGYRATSFSLRRDMDWAWKILAENGIRYDSSVFPVVHDRYGEPDAPRFPFMVRKGDSEIMEFPLPTVKALGVNWPVAGGGYLRLYPYAVTAFAVRRLNRLGHPAVIYLHPWELDPGQPRPAVSRVKLWRHRVGMRSLPAKLDRLLAEFEFAPLRQLYEQKRSA
jgi:polysaccharide deacetylase family protein (PEP-CTERM system associated)